MINVGATFYPNTPKYTRKLYLLYQLKVLCELFFIKKYKFHIFVTRVIKMNYYKHCFTNMAASNKYKCTQTHLKFIWYVLLTFNKYIASNTLLVILSIYIILFKKKRNKRKNWPLTTKKNYGSVIFCKASFIFNWKHFNTLWVFFSFFYLYINKVELFMSHS